MLKKVFFILIVGIILFSCDANNDNKMVKKVIFKNTDSMNKKDLKGYMETIYPEDTFKYNSTKRIVEFIFKNLDIETKIDSFSILSLSDETARVFTRMKLKMQGKEEVFNKMEHILIKKKNRWYIVNSLVTQ